MAAEREYESIARDKSNGYLMLILDITTNKAIVINDNRTRLYLFPSNLTGLR
jgi:hypothetical protein